MTPKTGILVLGLGHLSHRVKTQYSFSSTLGHKYQFIVKMTKEGSTKIVNLRRVEVLYNFDNALIYSTLIDIVLRGYNAALLCHC